MKNVKKKSKQRRIVLTVLLVILFALPIWVYRGNISIQTTQISINSEKIPASFKGFKIVQVSDLHNAEFGKNQSKLLRKVEDASPDIIVVTGDLIDSSNTDVEKAMDFITGAVKIAPVYYVTGNHEAWTDKYEQLEEEITRAGVVILKDKVITLEHDGDFIQLLGLDDPDFTMKGDTYGKSAAMIDTKLKSMQIRNDQYTILLSHRPELFDVYVANRIDLILSGHAHGGQIRLPFIGGLVAPNQGFFPTYSEGVYEKMQIKMVVSRGLGNSIISVRINNRPELVVITLVSQQNLEHKIQSTWLNILDKGVNRMKLGATLYIKNTIEAVAFYREAFGMTLGYNEKFPDGNFMHAALLKDGQEAFAVSESRNDTFVDIMLTSSLKESRPTMSYGITFDSEDEVRKAYSMLAKDGKVLFPLGSLPWSSCCADVVDKYGVYWYITV